MNVYKYKHNINQIISGGQNAKKILYLWFHDLGPVSIFQKWLQNKFLVKER
jgi:hypothetical protein